MENKTENRLRTHFEIRGPRNFAGFAADPDDLLRKFVVEILIDGYPFKALRADTYVRGLAEEPFGDGCYGFEFSLNDELVRESAVVEARLANLAIPVGVPLHLEGCLAKKAASAATGSIRWLGGLRFSGWTANDEGDAAADIFVDGVLVTRVRATIWSHVRLSEEQVQAVRAFDAHLPGKFADGKVHMLLAMNERGESLNGGPIPFLAFADGLRQRISGEDESQHAQFRAELFDRTLPMSVPFTDYGIWRSKLPVETCPQIKGRGAVVLVGSGKTEDSLESLQEQTHPDWLAVSFPHRTEPTSFQLKDAQAFLESADCDFVVFMLAGTLLQPSALQRIAAAFSASAEAEIVYPDVEIEAADGSAWPIGFSAFDYERLLEQGYCAHIFALRGARARRALTSGASDLYSLFYASLDGLDEVALRIVHLPIPIATLPRFDIDAASGALAAASRSHLLRRGLIATAAAGQGTVLPAAHIARRSEKPRTAIIIPTRNRKALLEGCIESILPAAARNDAEILVVDNESSDPETRDYLAGISRSTRILRVPGPFNFSRLNNQAARATECDILCLLNNDIEALDADWLEEMLGRLVEEDVGAVGAQLLWPSGVIQHAGVVLGPQFEAEHAFKDRVDGDPGYGDLLRVAHECSALTAACLLTRLRDFLAVEGMDEIRFPVNFNDLDYCLKLRARGKRIVFTPHAKLVHHESASRGLDLAPDRRARYHRELQNLRLKWGDVLAHDPYYNPILSLDAYPFSALAWPLRDMSPRVNRPLLAKAVPPGV